MSERISMLQKQTVTKTTLNFLPSVNFTSPVLPTTDHNPHFKFPSDIRGPTEILKNSYRTQTTFTNTYSENIDNIQLIVSIYQWDFG